MRTQGPIWRRVLGGCLPRGRALREGHGALAGCRQALRRRTSGVDMMERDECCPWHWLPQLRVV